MQVPNGLTAHAGPVGVAIDNGAEVVGAPAAF